MTNTVWFHLYVESKKQNKWTNIIKCKQSYKCREQISGCQSSEGDGRKRETGERDQGTKL